MENSLPQRKHPRLKHYDYGTAGAYYVTICTQNRRCLLSRIIGGGVEPAKIQYTPYGKIAEEQLFQTSFYEHVIRGREDYEEIAEYIMNNPKQWELDKLYSKE